MAISSGHQEHFRALKLGLHHQNMRLMHENDFAEQACKFEWVTPRLARFFSGNDITAVARQRGYELFTTAFL